MIFDKSNYWSMKMTKDKDKVKADAEKLFTSLLASGNTKEESLLLVEGHFAGLVAAGDSIVKDYKVVISTDGGAGVLTVRFVDSESYKITLPKPVEVATPPEAV